MYEYLKIPAFKSNLTIQDHVSAMKSIQVFVDSYNLDECRDHLWKLLQSGLTHQNNFDEPEERDSIILFVQQMEEMAEVLHFMFKNMPNNK
jgi:hypothetical protein